MIPVMSVILRVTEVPDARLTVHEYEVPWAEFWRFSRAAAPVCPPGMTSRMYGAVPPDQLIATG